MPTGYKTPLERKLAYVDNLASREGIDLSMLTWEFELDEILKNISFNVIFNYLLNIYLNFNLHFDLTELDFQMPDFCKFFKESKTKLSFCEIEKIEKGRYGISKYNKCIYDPEQVTSKPLQRLLWDLRYKTTEKDDLAYKHTSEALKQWIQQLKDYLTQRDVRDFYQDGMFETLALVEGKMLTTSYWDFAAFDVSVFSEENSFKARTTEDWKTESDLETVGIYECHFDWSRFDYARWGDVYEGGTIEVSEEIADELNQRITEFHQRSGFVEQYGEKTIYQRIFFYQKEEKMHWEGGHHQIRLQNLKNHIKRMLNEKGVIAQFRMAYLSFAQELFYMYYQPHRKYKRWKTILTDDELINKYVRMGCEKPILEEIKEVVVRWRP